MAQPNLVQRSLQSLNRSVRALRTGEGDGSAAALGRAAKKGLKKAKSNMDELALALGLGGMIPDGYDEDIGDQRRRKKIRTLMGEEETVFIMKDGAEDRDLSKTVAPEYRAQVSSGLAAANSMTAGSTLVGGASDDDW